MQPLGQEPQRADILFDVDRTDPANLRTNAPRLRWVQATSSGIGEFLKRTGLNSSNIVFTTAAGVHSRPLAEFALLGLLYFFRDMPQLEAMKKARHWERYTVEGLDGKRPSSSAWEPWGARSLDSAPPLGWMCGGPVAVPTAIFPKVSRWVGQSELTAILPMVDALVLACPLTDETRLLIGASELTALKPGAVLVNIARGGVIDEEALIRGLSSGRIKGAALDVFAVKPLPAESPIWALSNVIFSPHSASTAAAENSHIVDIFPENSGNFLEVDTQERVSPGVATDLGSSRIEVVACVLSVAS